MEIERKFLVAHMPPGLSCAPSKRLRQGYLATGPGGEVRVRDAGGSMTLTVKSGVGMTREETEIPLTVGQFEVLWPATEGRRVEKRRSVILSGNLRAEVDMYEGALAGMAVVEVEFTSEEAARAFVPPDWFGCEVTDDPAYKYASLALRGRPVG